MFSSGVEFAAWGSFFMRTWRARQTLGVAARRQAMVASRVLCRDGFPASFLGLRARFCCWQTRESRAGAGTLLE